MNTRTLLLFLFVFITQCFKSQNHNILDAKFSPNSNIIALIVGDDKKSDLMLYFTKTNGFSGKLLGDSLNNSTVSEFKFSPDGGKVALLVTKEMITDLFLYNIENGEITQCTGSQELKKYDVGLAYKNSLNWIDNNRVMFISKHLGLVQQYIFNFSNNKFEANGTSKGNEYFMTYSRKNQESYYIASINNREPSVYRRKLGSLENIEISKDGLNHMLTILSDENNYLFYTVLPEISPRIYDLRTSKLMKTKLPNSNVRIVGWSEKDTTFYYTYAQFKNNTSYPSTGLFSYNYLTKKDQKILNEIESNFELVSAPDGSGIIFSTSEVIELDPNKHKIAGLKTFIYSLNGTIKEFPFCGIAKDWSSNTNSVVFVYGSELTLLNPFDGIKKTIRLTK